MKEASAELEKLKPDMECLSGSVRCMGEKFCPCRTTIQLWEYGKKDHVYNKYGRKYPFEFSKGDEAGSVPE